MKVKIYCDEISFQMLWLVVTVLATTALGENRVYSVTETNNPIAGFYVQIEENSEIYQQLGGPNDVGYFTYLYNDPNNTEVWNIGIGKNKEKITGFYTASGANEGPPVKGWKSSNGKEKSFQVKKIPSLVSTLKETEENEGSSTLDGELICLKTNTSQWIRLRANDPKKCDGNVDCKNSRDETGDEDCGRQSFGKALLYYSTGCFKIPPISISVPKRKPPSKKYPVCAKL